MTPEQRRQTRRRLPLGLLVAALFGAVSVSYGSIAAGAVAVAGMLMALSSAVFLRLDSIGRKKLL